MSSTRLAEVVRKLASDTIDNSNPADVFYAEVTSAIPLKVETASLVLDDECIHICESVYVRGFKIGDIVALLRLHGGQDFLLIDKVVSI